MHKNIHYWANRIALHLNNRHERIIFLHKTLFVAGSILKQNNKITSDWPLKKLIAQLDAYI